MQKHDQGSFKVQSVYGHQLNPSAPEFQLAKPTRNAASSNFSQVNGDQSTVPRSTPPAAAGDWRLPHMYDSIENQIRKEFTPRCLERNEHMIAVFNLDPKTTKDELAAIFFPTGAIDSFIVDLSSGTTASKRKTGVVFFPHIDFALQAVKKIHDFAPQKQSQLLVVKYCGPAEPSPATTTVPAFDSLVTVLKDAYGAKFEQSRRCGVSIHSMDANSMSVITCYAVEKLDGKVEVANWIPNLKEKQVLPTELTSTVRTSIVSFRCRETAALFVSSTEKICDQLKAVAFTFALFPSYGESLYGRVNINADGQFTFQKNNNYDSVGKPMKAKSDSIKKTSPELLLTADGSGFQLNPWLSRYESSVLPQDSPQSATDLLLAATEQLTGMTKPLAPIMLALISHQMSSEREAKAFSSAASQALRDSCNVSLIKNYLCDFVCDSRGVAPLLYDKRKMFLDTFARSMINIVLQESYVSEQSRLAAGEISVRCFHYGYLPRNPCRFAVCALNRFELNLQKGSGLDPRIVLVMIRVLEHMMNCWRTLSTIDDTDAASFSQKKWEVIDLCERVGAENPVNEEKKGIQLTPSARPTPRPIFTRSSPSSSSSRREALRPAGAAGFPPQVKLSLMDVSNGISTDASVDSSTIAPKMQQENDKRKEDRSEHTVFVSSLPSALTHYQIRLLLTHFGELSRVRWGKSKSKHNAKPSSCSVFVEFTTKQAAQGIIAFFSNSDKDFTFLSSRGASSGVPDEVIQQLYSTSALPAKNEIRESHPSDAVLSVKRGTTSCVISKCTFGFEEFDKTPDDKHHFTETLSFTDLSVDTIPSKATEAESGHSDDDMADVLQACMNEPIELDFGQTLDEPLKSELDDPTYNCALFFDMGPEKISAFGGKYECGLK